jgi:uncharacterized protein YcbX
MAIFGPDDQALIEVWEAHTAAEFEHKDADAVIATMTERPVLIHVPVAPARRVKKRFENSMRRYSSRTCRMT